MSLKNQKIPPFFFGFFGLVWFFHSYSLYINDLKDSSVIFRLEKEADTLEH